MVTVSGSSPRCSKEMRLCATKRHPKRTYVRFSAPMNTLVGCGVIGEVLGTTWVFG